MFLALTLTNVKSRWISFLFSKKSSNDDEADFALYYLRLRYELHTRRLDALRSRASKEWSKDGWGQPSAVACDELCAWLRANQSPEVAARKDVEAFFHGPTSLRINVVVDQFFLDASPAFEAEAKDPVSV